MLNFISEQIEGLLAKSIALWQALYQMHNFIKFLILVTISLFGTFILSFCCFFCYTYRIELHRDYMIL